MDKKPIQYNYNGEILYIYPGNYFSKNELIIRLKEMNFTFADASYDKQDLVTIYEIATSYENNIYNFPNYKDRKDQIKIKEGLSIY